MTRLTYSSIEIKIDLPGGEVVGWRSGGKWLTRRPGVRQTPRRPVGGPVLAGLVSKRFLRRLVAA